MFRSRIANRLTAVFVVAFVCLNASGAVCVAYCQSFDISARTEHCPLQELSEHCNKAKNKASDSNAIVTTTGEADCCPFTISFIAAPVESNHASVRAVAATPVQDLLPALTFVADRTHSVIRAAYRGPPLDRRIDRLKRCIIRI